MLVDLTPTQLNYLHFLEAHKVKKEEKIYITQNQAYARFGRSNVERWVDQRKVQRHKRPTTMEYKFSELLKAAEAVQDYL